MPLRTTEAISLTYSPTSFFPHCTMFNKPETAFSFVLPLDPVDKSSKSTNTPTPETFLNASPASSHPAIRENILVRIYCN
ncbi:hypothetical protein Hanom_Chr04g00358691 [Helianthus anomalus]